MRSFLQPSLVLLACLVGVSGCGRRPQGYPETAPVSGRVTLDGKPLAGATICFSPPEGRSSSATTDQAGWYELSYAGRVKGAMPGRNRVTISKPVPDDPANLTQEERALLEAGEFSLPFVELLPDRYRGKTSELTADVEPGRNTHDFDLTSD